MARTKGGHGHRIYRRPDDSRVQTKHGKRMEFIKNQREEEKPKYGPITSCKCIKETRDESGKKRMVVCGTLFRSADPDEQFCGDCLYRLYVLPSWGARDTTVHHPQYD